MTSARRADQSRRFGVNIIDRLWRIRETLTDFADIAAIESAIHALAPPVTCPATFSMTVAEPAGYDDGSGRDRDYRKPVADLEDLVHKLCDSAFGDGLDSRDSYSGKTNVLRRKLIEGIALQADAREKGEATIALVIRSARCVVAYDWSDNDGDAVECVDQLRTALEALATQPAQASEKDNG